MDTYYQAQGFSPYVIKLISSHRQNVISYGDIRASEVVCNIISTPIGAKDWNARTHIGLFSKPGSYLGKKTEVNTGRAGYRNNRALFTGTSGESIIYDEMGSLLGKAVFGLPDVFGQGINSNRGYLVNSWPSEWYIYGTHPIHPAATSLTTQGIFEQHSMEFAILNVKEANKKGSIIFYTLFGDSNGNALGVMRREIDIEIDGNKALPYKYKQNTKLLGTQYFYDHMAASTASGQKEQNKSEVDYIINELRNVNLSDIDTMPENMKALQQNIIYLLKKPSIDDSKEAELLQNNGPSPLNIFRELDLINSGKGSNIDLSKLKELLEVYLCALEKEYDPLILPASAELLSDSIVIMINKVDAASKTVLQQLNEYIKVNYLSNKTSFLTMQQARNSSQDEEVAKGDEHNEPVNYSIRVSTAFAAIVGASCYFLGLTSIVLGAAATTTTIALASTGVGILAGLVMLGCFWGYQRYQKYNTDAFQAGDGKPNGRVNDNGERHSPGVFPAADLSRRQEAGGPQRGPRKD